MAPPSLRRWLLLLRIPAAIAVAVAFFGFYNRFVIDVNLRNLQTSLSVLDAAAEVRQAETALFLVDQTLVAQMAQEELNLQTLATLQYVRGTLATDRPQRPVDDAQVMVATLAEDQAASRPALLRTLDRMTSGLQETARRVGLLPRQLLQGEALEPMDPARLEQAARSERLGLLHQAAGIYEELLRSAPNASGRAGVKLRLAHVTHRLQEFDRASRLCQEVLRESAVLAEVQAARQMLRALENSRAKGEEVARLRQVLSLPASAEERQRDAFRLGSLLLEMYNFPEAAQAFHDAFHASPEGFLALPALFKEGWCLKGIGRFDDAFDRFKEVIRRQPSGAWAAAATQQMAEAYKLTGDYETAAVLYEQAIQKTEDAALAATVQAQLASTYLYDLQRPEQAQSHLEPITQSYPASPMSALPQRLAEVREKKEARRVRMTAAAPSTAAPGPPEPPFRWTEGAPLIAWLDRSLPLFAEVFFEHLARFMRMSGVTELSRRFTQEKFQRLVVRRVEERFPGRVKDISTEIHEDGFVGSGTVHLGTLRFPVRGRVGIVVRNERPYAVIHEIQVGTIAVPEGLRKFLEGRVNRAIEKAQQSLKIQKYELREGYAQISVRLVQ